MEVPWNTEEAGWGEVGVCVSGVGQGEAVQEMPASLRAAEEHRLSVVRVAGGRGHCRQRGSQCKGTEA